MAKSNEIFPPTLQIISFCWDLTSWIFGGIFGFSTITSIPVRQAESLTGVLPSTRYSYSPWSSTVTLLMMIFRMQPISRTSIRSEISTSLPSLNHFPVIRDFDFRKTHTFFQFLKLFNYHAVELDLWMSFSLSNFQENILQQTSSKILSLLTLRLVSFSFDHRYKSSKNFEKSFLKNGEVEFRSEALIVSIKTIIKNKTWVISVNYIIVKKFSKIFESSFLKNGIFCSKTLIVYILTYFFIIKILFPTYRNNQFSRKVTKIIIYVFQ